MEARNNALLFALSILALMAVSGQEGPETKNEQVQTWSRLYTVQRPFSSKDHSNEVMDGPFNKQFFTCGAVASDFYIAAGVAVSIKGLHPSDWIARDPLQYAWIVKTDFMGEVIWEKLYEAGAYGGPQFIIETSDKGFFIGGSGKGEDREHPWPWVFKLDSNGNLVWEYKAKEFPDEDVTAGIETKNGDYIFSLNDRIVRLDSEGKLIWNKEYGRGGCTGLHTLVELQDQDFIGAGWESDDCCDEASPWIIKINDKGKRLWEKKFIVEGEGPAASALFPMNNGAFVIAGRDFGFFLTINPNGKVLKKKELDLGIGDMAPFIDGGYLAIKTSWQGAGIFKLDKAGEILWHEDVKSDSKDLLSDIFRTPDNGFILAGGKVSTASGEQCGWLVKLDAHGNCADCEFKH